MIDGPQLWSYHRSKLGKSKREVACLGTSRTVCGFATAEFYRRFPEYNLRLLAVSGLKPAAALLDLARDPNFCGIVLCDVTWTDFRQANLESQQEYVDYYQNEYRAAAQLETQISLWLRERLVILSPEARPKLILRSLLSGRAPPVSGFHITKPDRSRISDYHLRPEHVRRKREAEAARYRKKAARRRTRPAPVTAEWLSEVRSFREPVEQIRARGGEVVFVRYPTSGERLAYTSLFYPRELYWDQIGPQTTARTIYYADYPELDPGDLADTSHLDKRQAPRFTNGLLDILQQQGILPSSGSSEEPPHQPAPEYAAPRGRIATSEMGRQ
ncbi:MAG: hypothetical protein KDA79_17435, partial [Planctomycetaceae bacterium]|nr:hypothetical protein [Planctomycetaceae bacterium]